MNRIYFDNSATTPIDPRVAEAMQPFILEHFGNPSSLHFFGQQARAALDNARAQVASIINASPSEIIFTSGGTESNNLAIRGLVENRVLELKNRGFGNTDDCYASIHLISSNVEHPSVKQVYSDMERRGCRVTFVPVNREGVVPVDDLIAEIKEDTLLVSVMAVNNEIGTLQPVSEIGAKVKELKTEGRKIFFHTDAVQAVGKIPIDVNDIGCDLLSFSGHKIYGPKGIAALYIKRSTRLKAQNLGGHQEKDRRGGTEAVHNIVGFGKAAEIAQIELQNEQERLLAMRNRLEALIAQKFPSAIFNGDRESRVPNIVNFGIPGIQGEALLINLDMNGVAVSTGSACSSGTIDPSPVILALGRNELEARTAIRLSLGRFNTENDVDRFIEILEKSAARLSKVISA